jgi:hypothetical protein
LALLTVIAANELVKFTQDTAWQLETLYLTVFMQWQVVLRDWCDVKTWTSMRLVDYRGRQKTDYGFTQLVGE